MTSRELFEKAVEVVLEHEGSVYTAHPSDKGGPTKFGISERWNPRVEVKDITREQAIEIYWTRYWQGRAYEQLPEALAVKAFDLAVNLGDQTVGRCLQRALWACGIRVLIDGSIGPRTIEAVHQVETPMLLAALRSEGAGEYRLRVARERDQEAFQGGWLKRAYS